jgi:hypothetical protein
VTTTERNYAEAELDGFFESPEDDPLKTLCMLKLYLDESIDNDTGMCLVAGYLGNKRQWKDYIEAWREELSPRTSIHIAELRLGSERAPKRHRALLSRLGGVPNICGLRPFAGSICRKDYENKVSGTALEVLMEGYVLAILGLMDELARHLNNERVKVFFEEQIIHASLRERAMVGWRKRYRTAAGWSILARWGSVPKGTMTEASDYLCYALQQSYINPNSQKSSLTSPILKQGVIGHHTGKDEVDEWLGRMATSRPIPQLTASLRKKIREGNYV